MRFIFPEDPRFAEAHTGLAKVWLIRGWYTNIGGSHETEDNFEMAKAAAEHALSLDPTIVSAYATLGAVFFNQGKFDEAEAAFQKALTMNPNHSFGHHWYSHLLLVRGELDRSLEEIDLAVQLDPLSFITVLIASIWHSFAADYEEALALNDRAMALGPEIFPPLEGVRSSILMSLGRKKEAVAWARSMSVDLTLQPRWWTDSIAIHTLQKASYTEKAQNYANRILDILEDDSYQAGFISMAIGQNNKAIKELSQNTIPPSLFGVIHYTSVWDEVRDDPLFLQLIDELGVKNEYEKARASRARLIDVRNKEQ